MTGKFKVGDTVQLKSGGPSMTVSSGKNNNDQYHCTWFKGASLETGYFKEETLKEYKAPKKDE
ncbi:YodC family protein [Hansschlegelia quercus]|uniref:DUF2158 domain-containing protein n=1 Tax=Hansschlegelia quercus TaxID=2528245 RepID=A0A4Q9GPJ7_9HYPH|nr:DUF2158 domain-containing protein [Hansschlegelia quercus]TBN54714.1 DUF2158 domain-containing protein [Hansschlegelia quercus]